MALAELFEVTDRTIRNWVADGMPRIADGKYNLLDCFNWWQENINKASDKEEKARERYWSAKADREELAVKKLMETVLERRLLENEWCKRVQEIVRGLESQETIFPEILTGKTKQEIRTEIEDYNRKLRENYARDGKFTPVGSGPKKKATKRKPAKKAAKKK